MATRLKNILRFVNVPTGVPTVLPHDLNVDDRAVPPDLVLVSDDDFTVTANATTVTVTNSGPAGDVNVYVEHWHSLERAFNAAPSDIDGELVPQPFVLMGSDPDGTVDGPFFLSSDITPPALGAGPTPDYNPAGLAEASTIRQDMSAPGVVTGLAGGADGRIIILHNISAANTLTLNHEDVGSAAANRFLLPGAAPVVIAVLDTVMLRYDATSSRWRLAA